MAFGETFVDEHSVSPTRPYLFNGKELDYETGLYYYGARYYDPKVSIFLNVDPLVEKTGTPYAYTYNNPINFIDPDGREGISTHTDKFGNVVAVYDDGDLGIYKHNGDREYTRNELKQKYNKNNTSGGGVKMGTTLTKYSFAKNGDFNQPYGKINFDSNWNQVNIQWGITSTISIADYAMDARNNKRLDLKSKEVNTEYDGSIIYDNVYGSRRDAGNFLAGAMAAKSLFPTEYILYGYGAYNASDNKIGNIPYTIGMDILTVGTLLKPPYYGEDKQSGAAILQGVKHHKKFPNNWIYPPMIKLKQ